MDKRLDDQGHGDKPRESTPRTDAARAIAKMDIRAGLTAFELLAEQMERELAQERHKLACIADFDGESIALAEERGRLSARSAVVASEPDRALADRIENEVKQLKALTEDRGDPEYWVLQTFLTHTDRICAALRAPRSASESILKAIDDEPELPGEMPDEMWEAIKGDRDATQAAMRIAVRQTKAGIRARVTKSVPDSRANRG